MQTKDILVLQACSWLRLLVWYLMEGRKPIFTKRKKFGNWGYSIQLAKIFISILPGPLWEGQCVEEFFKLYPAQIVPGVQYKPRYKKLNLSGKNCLINEIIQYSLDILYFSENEVSESKVNVNIFRSQICFKINLFGLELDEKFWACL